MTAFKDEENEIDEKIGAKAVEDKRIIGVGTRKLRANNNAKNAEASKFDRLVKTGFSKQHESLGFPNFFLAQKVRAKITATDEKFGNEFILPYVDDKDGDAKVKDVDNQRHESTM